MEAASIFFERIPAHNTVVHCDTREKAEILYEAVRKAYPRKLRAWTGNEWNTHREKSCYNLRLYDASDGMTFGPLSHYKREGYTILSFEEVSACIDLPIEPSDKPIDFILGI